MNTSHALNRRLDTEAALLSRFFPSMRWYNDQGQVFVEGPVHTNAGNEYDLRVVLPGDYPCSLPMLLVTYPAPLLDCEGYHLGERGPSGTMHVLGAPDGFLSVCHYDPAAWHPNHTLYRVLVKGRVWLEAYETHLATGDNIDVYLTHPEPQ